MRPLKIAVEIGLLFNIEHAALHLFDNHTVEWAYTETTFTAMLHQMNKQSVQPIKFYWLLNCTAQLVQPLENTLRNMGFEGEAANLTNEGEIIDYLDRCDVFFSPNSKLLYEASVRGILTGYLPKEAVEAKKLTIAFDHRIFMEEYNQPALKSWLRLIGYLQKYGSKVRAALITTNSSSVEKKVIDLFQDSECSINDLFYLAAGTKSDVFKLFKPCLYFEGKLRREIKAGTQSRPLLFVTHGKPLMFI